MLVQSTDYQGEVKWAVILTTSKFVYSLPDDLGSSYADAVFA